MIWRWEFQFAYVYSRTSTTSSSRISDSNLWPNLSTSSGSIQESDAAELFVTPGSAHETPGDGTRPQGIRLKYFVNCDIQPCLLCFLSFLPHVLIRLTAFFDWDFQTFNYLLAWEIYSISRPRISRQDGLKNVWTAHPLPDLPCSLNMWALFGPFPIRNALNDHNWSLKP